MILIKYFLIVILISVVSCANKHPYGEQIPIQISDDRNTNFHFKDLKKILLHQEVRNRKVVLLSIIGGYRKGKSFFLDYCLRFLYAKYPSINRKTYFTKKQNWIGEPNEPLTGFSWKSGRKAETKGILLWSDVFLHEKNGEKIAIMLMDTHGLFELERTPLVDTKIFGISSFLSSVQILNLNDVIQENELEYLKMVTDFTKIALKRQNEKSLSSSSKPFQDLLFLVRDWSDEEVGFGYEGGINYLKTVLTSKGGNDSAQAVRNNIRNTYDNVEAFLLPHPGQIRTNKYDGSLKKLEPDFVEYLKVIIERLLSPEKLVIKKLFNKEVTGNDLMDYATAIFLAYQSSELPEIDSIFNIAVVNEMNKLTETVYDKYTMSISQCTYFEDNNFLERLSNDHEKYQKAAVDEFVKMPKMGDEPLENKFKDSLKNKTDIFFLRWKPKAMKTHIDVVKNKLDKVNAEKMAVEYRRQMLEEQQRSADMRRRQEVDDAARTATRNVKGTLSYQVGKIVCGIFTLGLADCG